MRITRVRLILFVSALVMLAVGQYAAQQRSPLVPLPFAQVINTTLKTQMVNPENIWLALLLDVGAFVVCCFAFQVQMSSIPFISPTEPDTVPSLTGQGISRRDAILSQLRRWPVPVLLITAGAAFVFVIVQLHAKDTNPALFWPWCFVIAALTTIAFWADRVAGVKFGIKLSRWEIVALIGLTAAALLIGTYELNNIPNSIIGDEGSFLEYARNIALGTSKNNSFFQLGVYSYGLASTLYQATVLKLTGISLWGWRFSSVLAGVLCIVPTYLLLRELISRRAAVFTLCVMMTLPYMLSFERLGYNNIQAILPTVLGLYCLYLALDRNSLTYAVVGAVASGLGFYTYSAGKLAAVLGAVYIIYILIRNWRVNRAVAEPSERRDRFVNTLLVSSAFALTGAVTVLPGYVFGTAESPTLYNYKTFESWFSNVMYAGQIYSEDELYRDYPPIKQGDQTLFYRPDLYVQLLARGTILTVASMQEPFAARHLFNTAPLAGTVGGAFFMLGLFVVLRKPLHYKAFMLLIWTVLGMILLSILNTSPPRHQHMIPSLPAFAALVGLGMSALIDFVEERLHAWTVTRQRIAVGVLASALTLIVIVPNLINYFVDMPKFFTPVREFVLLWMAFDTKAPTTYVYFYSNDVERDTTRPQALNWLETKVTYVGIDVKELPYYTIKPDTIYRYIITPTTPPNVRTFLNGIYGKPLHYEQFFGDKGNLMFELGTPQQ